MADLNGDGVLDLVTANHASNNVSVLLGRGDGTFLGQTQFAVREGPSSVAVVDLNGDEMADLVTANGESDNVSVLLGGGLVVSSGPVTNCTLAGEEGDAGWFLSSVVVTLEAAAPVGEIERIEYRFGEDDAWLVYDQPITIDLEGGTSLHYRAIDDGGRIEAEQIHEIHVDTLPPATTLEARGTADSGGFFLGGAQVNLSATDPGPGSGVRLIEYRLDDGDWRTYVNPVWVSQLGMTTMDYRAVNTRPQPLR